MPTGSPKLALLRDWPKSVISAYLSAVALARLALVEARSWCVNSPIARVRLAAENEQLDSEVAMLREELRINDARLSRHAGHGQDGLKAHVEARVGQAFEHLFHG